MKLYEFNYMNNFEVNDAIRNRPQFKKRTFSRKIKSAENEKHVCFFNLKIILN